MKRRNFLGGIGAAVAAFSASAWAMRPRSVFAKDVRDTQRRLNRNGKPHIERRTQVQMPYLALEDAEAFHERAELVRLAMIEELRKVGAPINVWRVGVMRGNIATNVDVYTGETVPWKDIHFFTVRTRASVEHQPFDLPLESC